MLTCVVCQGSTKRCGYDMRQGRTTIVDRVNGARQGALRVKELGIFNPTSVYGKDLFKRTAVSEQP